MQMSWCLHGLCATHSSCIHHASIIVTIIPVIVIGIIILCYKCRDGTVYGCGSTEFGQLPYLKFTAGAAGTEPALPHSMDQDGEPSHQTRNEVTVPTRLNLQFLQQQRGNKSAVVSSMVAGSYCSALLTRAPDELPDHRHTCLSDRYLFLSTVVCCLRCMLGT